MEIDAEYLRQQRENMEQQRQEANALANQAAGAIALIDALKQRLDDDSLSLDDLGKALGGEVHPIGGHK